MLHFATQAQDMIDEDVDLKTEMHAKDFASSNHAYEGQKL